MWAIDSYTENPPINLDLCERVMKDGNKLVFYFQQNEPCTWFFTEEKYRDQAFDDVIKLMKP